MSFHLKNNSIINKSKKRKRDIWKGKYHVHQAYGATSSDQSWRQKAAMGRSPGRKKQTMFELLGN